MHNVKCQGHIHGSKLHIPPTNNHLLAAQQEPYKNKKTLNKTFLSEKVRKMDH